MLMESTTPDVLWENEVNANKVMVVASFATAGAYVIAWILTIAEVIYMEKLDHPHLMCLIVILALCIPALIAIRFRCEKPWIKYILMGSIILSFIMIDAIYTENVPFLMVIPIVLASRYFSIKYTIIITIFTDVAFLISAILGVYIGAASVSCLELPAGTVIDMGEYTWISDIVDAGGVPYDKALMVKNVLIYSYLIRLFISMIVTAVCLMISSQGRRIIFRQKELTEQSARMQTELSLATEIQLGALQSDFPVFPERKEIEIYASSTPAKEVGGDFYDFFFVDEDHLCLVIADVSGKGVPAALYMMAAKMTLRNHARMGKSPAKILTDANADICENNDQEMFVTVWLAILEISTGRLVAGNAGHEFPILRRGGKRYAIYRDNHDLVLGGMEDVQYQEYMIDLKPGDTLFVYTDGIPEAPNAEGQMYGEIQLVKALNEDPTATPAQILKNVRKSVELYVQDVPQFDDMTMLCMEYKGKGTTV